MGPYAASKSAVHRLTESLADELKLKGVTVNAVLPSIIDTPANRRDMPKADFNRWVAPADLAAVMLFLASDEAKAVTGALIPCRGGCSEQVSHALPARPEEPAKRRLETICALPAPPGACFETRRCASLLACSNATGSLWRRRRSRAPSACSTRCLAVVATARIIQLTDARDASARPATDVDDESVIEATAAIGEALEGKTARQRNPHRRGSLSWLAWITARLGGWHEKGALVRPGVGPYVSEKHRSVAKRDIQGRRTS